MIIDHIDHLSCNRLKVQLGCSGLSWDSLQLGGASVWTQQTWIRSRGQDLWIFCVWHLLSSEQVLGLVGWTFWWSGCEKFWSWRKRRWRNRAKKQRETRERVCVCETSGYQRERQERAFEMVISCEEEDWVLFKSRVLALLVWGGPSGYLNFSLFRLLAPQDCLLHFAFFPFDYVVLIFKFKGSIW